MCDVTNSITTITINILPDISKCKGKQVTECGQLIEYKEKNIFFRNHTENEPDRLAAELFCFFKKLYMKYKQVVSNLVLIYFGNRRLGHTIK